MTYLSYPLLIFSFIEILNVITLYFYPSSTYGNGIGVFADYHKLKESEHSDFVHYLINWVAGAKIIFILLGIIIAVFGTLEIQLYTCIALVISIASFYYRLYPTIKKMDNNGKIVPKGYSKGLHYMIFAMILVFLGCAIYCVI